MMPELEYVAAQFADTIACYKVDILNAREIREHIEVPGVPYIIAYANGSPIATRTQTLSRSELISLARNISK